MKLKTMMLIGLATSCGAQTRPNNKNKISTTPPTAAIIAIPIDSSGHELEDLAEIRSLQADSEKTLDKVIEQDLPKIYQTAQKEAQVIATKEDAFMQKVFQGWYHYRSCPSRLVRIPIVLQQEPLIFDSCQAYYSYQPTYLRNGQAFRFFFQKAHRQGSVSYYYYVKDVTSDQVVGAQHDGLKQVPQKEDQDQDQDQNQQQPAKQSPVTSKNPCQQPIKQESSQGEVGNC